MNPVLLKPNTDTGAQVIVHGRAVGEHGCARLSRLQARRDARPCSSRYRAAGAAVRRASSSKAPAARPRSTCATATSPTWASPRRSTARCSWSPTSTAAACSRTSSARWLCLRDERARIAWPGSSSTASAATSRCCNPGLDWLERQTGKPVLGVLPYLHGLHLEAEDAVPRARHDRPGARLRVVVPVLPRISNHTDFDRAARCIRRSTCASSARANRFRACDLIVLPGSKSVRADLAWLRAQGWDHAHRAASALRRQGDRASAAASRCSAGAFDDPHGVEGVAGAAAGLGLLEIETTISPDKRLVACHRAPRLCRCRRHRLRDSHGRDDRRRTRPSGRVARRASGRRGLGRRPNPRHLPSRPVRPPGPATRCSAGRACASRKRPITTRSVTRTSTGWPMLAKHTSISAPSSASWESILRAAEHTRSKTFDPGRARAG